jgi:5-formyltetrahydrofolate cyclo-ligase
VKDQLRAQLRAARIGRRASDDWVQRVLDRIPSGSLVCGYVSLPSEPPTTAILEALLARGDRVYLPVAGHGLAWVAAEDSRPWQAWGLRGVACPVAPVALPLVDVILVPALAVDRSGRRLGQGGGYYDRFVPHHAQARTIALLWSGEVLASVHAEPHDIRVDEWVVADE